MSSNYTDENSIRVLYGEVYGGNVTQASKNYTSNKTFGFRIFDIAEIDLAILNESIDKISSWREHGSQEFANVSRILTFASGSGLATVPYISTINGRNIPKDRISIYSFLQQFEKTQAGINNDGRSEGIVVRSFDRSLIRKIRFEDYERTAKREGWKL